MWPTSRFIPNSYQSNHTLLVKQYPKKCIPFFFFTQCVSEAERYAAKGSYVAKPQKNKGAQKQEIWTECIQELSEQPKIDKTLRNILQKIAGQSNVPRKKPKFINFLKSSMKYNIHQSEKVWTIIEDGLEEFKKRSAPSQTQTPITAPVSPLNEGEVSSTTELKTNENGNDYIKKAKSNDDCVSTTNKTSDIVHLNAILDHALEQDDLTKSVKKILKKLKKQTDYPLNGKPPKKNKFLKLLQDKLKLDAENSLAVWECISMSMNALGQTKGNATAAGVQVIELKKRKNSETDNNEAEPKRPKIENGHINGGAVNGNAFDWPNNIIRIFQKSQSDNQVAIDSLRSKVIKKFVKASGQDGTQCKEEHFKKFKKQLKKVDSLVIAGDFVQLKP